MKVLFRFPSFYVGAALIICLVFIAVFAPLIAPHDPMEVNILKKYLPPSPDYPLGCDQLGRCELSRLIYGARLSLALSLPTLALLGVLGLIFGCLAACAGPRADKLLGVIFDSFMAFPLIVIVIALSALMGKGVQSLCAALVVGMWAWFARAVRAFALIEFAKDYIPAARIAGCSSIRLVLRHVIPNITAQYTVFLSGSVASCILMISGFSFLGVGVPGGAPEWGAMLSEAKASMYNHPDLLIWPGLCLLLTAAGFNLLSEALRGALTPGEANA